MSGSGSPSQDRCLGPLPTGGCIAYRPPSPLMDGAGRLLCAPFPRVEWALAGAAQVRGTLVLSWHAQTRVPRPNRGSFHSAPGSKSRPLGVPGLCTAALRDARARWLSGDRAHSCGRYRVACLICSHDLSELAAHESDYR